jgi:hypothetical protein
VLLPENKIPVKDYWTLIISIEGIYSNGKRDKVCVLLERLDLS